MRIKRQVVMAAFIMVVAALLGVASIAAQGPKPQDAQSLSLGTAFTYQGQVKNAGTPVNGSCDIAFRLYDALSGPNQVGVALMQTLIITNGLFTTPIDFGAGAFNGDARWLDMQVRCPSGAGAFTALNPRQLLSSTPYALFAAAPWASNGSAIYYNNGNVGIGITSPSSTLNVNSASPVRILASTASIVGSGYADFFFKNASTSYLGGMRIQRQSLTGNVDTMLFAAASGQPAAEILRVTGNGSVGIGTTTTNAQLDVLEQFPI